MAKVKAYFVKCTSSQHSKKLSERFVLMGLWILTLGVIMLSCPPTNPLEICLFDVFASVFICILKYWNIPKKVYRIIKLLQQGSGGQDQTLAYIMNFVKLETYLFIYLTGDIIATIKINNTCI